MLPRFEGETIRALRVSPAGDLSVNFDGTSQPSAEAAADYEAWPLSVPRGETVLCMPRGTLAIWGPRAE